MLTGGAQTAAVPVATCQYCGAIHAGRCPAVAAIEYYPDGSVKRVEFLSPQAPPSWPVPTSGQTVEFPRRDATRRSTGPHSGVFIPVDTTRLAAGLVPRSHCSEEENNCEQEEAA